MATVTGMVGVDVDVLKVMLAEGPSYAQRAMLRAIPGAAFAVFDRELRLVFAEGDVLFAEGLDPECDLEGRLLDDVRGPEFAPVREAYVAAIDGRSVEIDFEYRARVRRLHAAPVFDDDGRVVAGVSISLDVTDQRRAEARVARHAGIQSALFTLSRRALDGMRPSRLVQAAAEAVAEALAVDAVSVVRFDNDARSLVTCANVGWPVEKVRRTPVTITDEHLAALTAHGDHPEIHTDLSQSGSLLASLGVVSAINAVIGPHERPFGLINVSAFTQRDFSVDDGQFVQTVADILWSAIERAETEERYRHEALHDALTGLPNLAQLKERLGRSLGRAAAERGALAVVLVDLDQFKVINDSLGRRSGDELLRTVASRLAAMVRTDDLVGRITCDTFGLICGGIISDEHALQIADRVAIALGEPYELAGRRHAVKLSIGVVVDGGESTPEALLRDADTALHRAKERGGACIELFTPEIRERAVARMRTETDLHRAIERDELRLHYQPYFSIPDRRMLGVEALVRWQHPRRGLLAPDEFIPLAEHTGLIVELGAWVLGAAARTLATWRATLDGARELSMSVNVSTRQLVPNHGQDKLGETLHRVLSDTGLPPNLLALEITESMLMNTGAEPQAALAGLRDLGVQIMLDDFGTGYSSLGRLSEVPLDVVKIDRRFVNGLGEDHNREPIVAAIIAMADALGLRVIAEGVETERQWQSLVSLGCRAAQGYLLARPMPAEDLAALIETRAGRRAA